MFFETQIYELKKGQQNNKNKTKLESLKEMVKLNFTKPNHIIPDWKKGYREMI